VPFFLYGYNAWVEGIGEKISPVLVPPSRFVVVKPHAGIETARIFGSPALERATKTATISDFAVQPYDFGRNDLQPVAQALCPERNGPSVAPILRFETSYDRLWQRSFCAIT